MNFINPKTDFAFKRIFGSNESKNILISFLNALIYNSQTIIEDLEIIDPYLTPALPGLKDTYLDVQAKLKDGSLVIIEMQVLNVESFEKRILYNAAKAYSLQLQSGEGYRSLKPVIALTIVDFTMLPDLDQLISHFVFQEKLSHLNYIENALELVFVELPKFQKQEEELESLTDKWIYFIKSAPRLNSVPPSLGEVPEIQQAFQIADRANLTLQELEELQKREMFIHDQQGAILLAKKEGRQEKALEIARQLLDIMDDQTIMQITKLPIEEIRHLRERDGV